MVAATGPDICHFISSSGQPCDVGPGPSILRDCEMEAKRSCSKYERKLGFKPRLVCLWILKAAFGYLTEVTRMLQLSYPQADKRH